MPLRRAFTLIELLVVIAIISILASIMFPAFAQAKVAAKAAVSLSNVNQLGLAQIMYASDNDDLFVPVGYQDPTAPVGWDPYYIRSWSQIIYPYTKNADILLDPLSRPDDYSWGPRQWIIGYFPQYGYAFEVLSPVVGVNQPRPLSQTSLGSVSNTVMMTAKGTAYVDYTPYWDGSYGGNLDSSFTIRSPWCNMSTGWVDSGVNPSSWCNYVQPGWRNSWGYDSNLGMSFESGGYTGLVSLRKQGKGIVCFTDGHYKILSDSQLAAGTNYHKNRLPADLTITDKEKYIWDAD